MEEQIQIPNAVNYYCRKDGTIYNSKTGNVIRGAKHGNGYLTVYLRMDDNKRKKFFVHRLIAQAFCENLGDYTNVDHLNGFRDDNRAENLEWVSPSENTQRGYNAFNYRRNLRTDYSYRTLTGVV